MAIYELLRYGQRLAGMPRDELLDRSRQAVAKRSDAALHLLRYSFAKNSRKHTASVPGSFFFAPESVDAILELIRQRLPGRAEQIVEEAEQILQHRFDLLGYESLNYANPTSRDLDWHWDAVHGKRAPKKAFHRIRYLDYDECGDSKIIWELNRHQHFVTLAKAYRFTNDLRYVDEIFRQKQHWQDQNPYPRGINWVSSLEVAFRSLSWLWTYYLLRGSPGIPDFRGEWLRDFALNGRHIERYLSTYSSPNTHLLGEALGLFFLGVLCPELPAAARWKSVGWQILLRESERQVRADGFYFEQSTYYHVYALDFFLHAALMATGNDIPVPKSFENTVEKMLSVLYLLGRNGPPPQFGDDDGGRLFDPRRNRCEHLLDPLATGAVLFRRGDFKTLVGTLREETLWLLGAKGVRLWDQLNTAEVVPESTALAQAGLYFLTSEKTQLIVDTGPLGAHSGGHGHADACSVCLQSRGRPLLIDCGTAEYVGAGEDRNLFRGTKLHNTLRVDGLDQAEPGTAFSWQKLPESKVEQWFRGRNFDLLVVSHDGYHRLNPPITHRRCVISLKNEMYLVRDVVEGSGKHRLDVNWHLAPDLELAEDQVFRVKDGVGGLAFFSAPASAWVETLKKKMWSPAYGYKSSTSALTFCAEAILPSEFAVVLRPFGHFHLLTGGFSRIECAQPNASIYRYSAEEGEYLFVFNDRGVLWQSGALSSDARFVCHKRGTGPSEEQLIFCSGSYAITDGGAELRCSRPVAWAELVTSDAGRWVSCSDASAVIDQTASLGMGTASAICGEL